MDEHTPWTDEWRQRVARWFAYSEQPGESGDGDRLKRLERQPDTTLANPQEVADWIEEQHRRYAARPGDSLDVRYRHNTNGVLASQGQSLYIDIKNAGPSHLVPDMPVVRKLYVEAMSD